MEEMVAKNPPISDADMKAYLRGDGDVVCTAEHFRIDFQRPWRKTTFNQEAEQVFIDTFFQARDAGQYNDIAIPPVLLSRQSVSHVLWKHMEYRRRCYRLCKSPPSNVDEESVKKLRAASLHRRTASLIAILSTASTFAAPAGLPKERLREVFSELAIP